jgi:hypothetical protein
MKQMQTGEADAIRSKIHEVENRLAAIASTLKTLYEDKCSGKIPETVFLNLMDSFTKEQAGIEERLPRLREEFSNIRETTDKIGGWLSLISSYTDIETLDRAIVTGLIDSITVSERNKASGRQTQELSIEYRFIGNLLQNASEGIA